VSIATGFHNESASFDVTDERSLSWRCFECVCEHRKVYAQPIMLIQYSEVFLLFFQSKALETLSFVSLKCNYFIKYIKIEYNNIIYWYLQKIKGVNHVYVVLNVQVMCMNWQCLLNLNSILKQYPELKRRIQMESNSKKFLQWK